MELRPPKPSWSYDDRRWGANHLNKRKPRKEGIKIMANPRQESQSTSQVGQEARRMADESARAGRKTVETGERIARVTGDATRAAADAGERATRVGADLFEQNADAVQQIWYSGM